MVENEIETSDVVFQPDSDSTTNERPDVIRIAKPQREHDKENSNRKVRIWKKYPTFRRQIFSCICAIFGSLAGGVTYGFIGTLLPSLRHHGYIDDEAGSWLAGVIVLTRPVGVMINSLLMPRYGRKACIIYSNVPWIIGWIMLLTGSDFWTFLAACVLVGSACGSNSTALTVYVSEISDGRLRGFMNGVLEVFFSCGILVAHFFEIVFYWRTALALCAAMPALCCISATFSPEAPHWLVLRGRLDKAEKNFYWLRGVSSDSVKEFDDILRRREKNVALKQRGLMKNLLSRKFWVPFRIIALLFFVQIFTGGDILVFYALDALQRMSPTIDAKSTIMAVDILRFAANILSCYLVKKFNRRHLIFVSCLGGLVSMLMITATMHLHLPDLLLSFLVCAQVTLFTIGIVPISWIMIPEIFPQVIREVGSGIAQTYVCLTCFVFAKISLQAMNLLGMKLLYCIFSSILALGTILLYFVVPETQKLSLQEVEDIVRKRKPRPIVQIKQNPVVDIDNKL